MSKSEKPIGATPGGYAAYWRALLKERQARIDGDIAWTAGERSTKAISRVPEWQKENWKRFHGERKRAAWKCKFTDEQIAAMYRRHAT